MPVEVRQEKLHDLIHLASIGVSVHTFQVPSGVLGIPLRCQCVRLSLLGATHSIAEPNTFGDLGNFQPPPSANFPVATNSAAVQLVAVFLLAVPTKMMTATLLKTTTRIMNLTKKMKIMKTKRHNIMFPIHLPSASQR
jgi:hypothetical protein